MINYEVWKDNSSFSKDLERTQIYWDSTSLNAFQKCPRYYYYSIVLGLRTQQMNDHLKFGIIYHSATELYERLRAEGKDHNAALLHVVKDTMKETWDSDLGRPWQSVEPNKTRSTLLRTIIWYLDQFQNDPIKTVILSNGKPAVELSFRLGMEFAPLHSKDGPEYHICGHLDRLGTINDTTVLLDKKTTQYALDDTYFANFTPDTQFSLYPFAAGAIYPEPIKGIYVDAAQVGVTFSRFERRHIQRTPSQIDEFISDFMWATRIAETYARGNYYPQNPNACGYGKNKCAFHGICSRPSNERNDWLRMGFKQEIWNPMETR